MVILFTGMSGIGIRTSLERYIKSYKLYSKELPKNPPILISLEQEIEEAFYNANSHKARSKSTWLHLVLTESYPNLEKYWKIACDMVIKKVDELTKKEPDRFLFINLHAAYYHYKTQEYFSLIFLNRLKRLKPLKIITFIDDIYEIHERLTQPGGIYHDEPNPHFTALISRYSCLLNWRSKEIMMSRFLANQMGCKNYVFAVKHPNGTLSKLIQDKTVRIYLSHPISEVRRLEKAKKFRAAKRIKDEITTVSELLTNNFTTFLPTTIDEYRIKNEKVRKPKGREVIEQTKFQPVLTKRWEVDMYNHSKDTLYTPSGFQDQNNLWQKPLTKKRNLATHEVLTGLADLISDQVTTRDYTLVEQSDAIVIYRPLFNGNASGGVKEEHNYFIKLKEDLNTGAKCFIYCPQQDIDRYSIKEFEARIQNEINETKKLKLSSHKKFNCLTITERKKLINTKGDNSLVLDVLNDVLDHHEIKINVQNSKSPLGVNKFIKFKDEFVKEFVQGLNIVSDYETSSTIFNKDSLSIKGFVNKISTHYNSIN